MVNVQVPFFFKHAVDAMADTGSLAAGLVAVPTMLLVGCAFCWAAAGRLPGWAGLTPLPLAQMVPRGCRRR